MPIKYYIIIPLVLMSFEAFSTKDIFKDKIPQYQNYLKSWEKLQRAKATELPGFEFTDMYEGSGIDFEHHSSEYSGASYMAVHYDHGNGMTVSDIDGDGLIDIYFTTQEGSNALFKNLGYGKFKNITSEALSMKNKISVSAAFVDLDNDGLDDLVVTTVRNGIFLFKNLGNGKFEDVTKQSGLTKLPFYHSSGIIPLDYNRDGKLDLFITNVGVYTENKLNSSKTCYVGLPSAFEGHLIPARFEPSFLLKNLGGLKFSSQKKDVIFELGWNGDGTIVDLNEDLYPDLYLTNMQGDDSFWINQKGKKFKLDKSTFPKTSWGAMGVKFFDFNRDLKPDLYVTDMHSDMFAPLPRNILEENIKTLSEQNMSPAVRRLTQYEGRSIFGNSFYMSSKSGYKEVSDLLGAENYWPWGLSVGDINADGYEDVFITAGMNYPFPYAINKLLLNQQGRFFQHSEFLTNIEPRKNKKVMKEWFHLDCPNKDKNHPNCKGEKEDITVWGALGSRSSVIFDVDNDGDLDIVTNEFNDRPQLLISNLAQKNKINYLKIKLIGTSSNSNGIGSHVILTTEKSKQYRYCDGKIGYLSHGNLPLYFGIEQGDRAKEINIKWPSGIIQKIKIQNDAKEMKIVEAK